jgi:hypothetical protein
MTSSGERWQFQGARYMNRCGRQHQSVFSQSLIVPVVSLSKELSMVQAPELISTFRGMEIDESLQTLSGSVPLSKKEKSDMPIPHNAKKSRFFPENNNLNDSSISKYVSDVL